MYKLKLRAMVCGIPAGSVVEVAGFLTKYGDKGDLVLHKNSDDCATIFLPIELLGAKYEEYNVTEWFVRKPNGDIPMVYTPEVEHVWDDGIIRKAVKICRQV